MRRAWFETGSSDRMAGPEDFNERKTEVEEEHKTLQVRLK